MKPIHAKTITLSRLRVRFQARVFALPELQREFVWPPAKARELVDSIYHGYPIGVPTIWKTRRRNEFELRHVHHVLPQFDEKNKDIQFIIDGQQRLSCLYHLLCEEAGGEGNGSTRPFNFRGILFRCGGDDETRRFAFRAGPVPDGYVSVVDVLSPRWRQRVGRRGARELARIGDCRRRLLSYRLTFSFIQTDRLEEVQESFVRINSLGTPIGGADRAFARASRIKLRHLLRGVHAEMGKGFGAIESEPILQSMAFLMGETDLGERSVGRMAARLDSDDDYADRFKRKWATMQRSLGAAADYIAQTYGMRTRRELPSDYLVSLLALFFFHRKNRRPSRPAKASLARWFWSTVVGSRYTGRGFRPNIQSDADFMQRLGRGQNARFPAQPLVPLRVIRDADYSRPGMVTQGFFALLRLQRPRYLEDGEVLPLVHSTRSNRSDRHHIYPRGLLTRAGLGPAYFNQLPNICLVVAQENQSIGSKHPAKYLLAISPRKGIRTRALSSHLIPHDARCGIWDANTKRGYRTFLDARTRMLARAFEEQAGTALFRRDF